MRQTPRRAGKDVMRPLQFGKIHFGSTRIRVNAFASLTKCRAQLIRGDHEALFQTQQLIGIKRLHDDEI